VTGSITVFVSGVQSVKVLPYAVPGVFGVPSTSTTGELLTVPFAYETVKVCGVQIAVKVLFEVPVIGEPEAYVFVPSLQPPKVNPGLESDLCAGAVTTVPPVVYEAVVGTVPVAPFASKVNV
jgi:hypothetical protein